MSDTASIDETAKRLRAIAAGEAEARWQADEARRAVNVEAHTDYLVAARMSLRIQEDRITEQHADIMRVNDALMVTNARQSEALERIAAALEAMGAK